MKGLVDAAFGVLRRQIRPVALLTLGLGLPGQVLIRVDETIVVGSILMLLADLAVLSVLLADLQNRPLSTVRPSLVLRAAGRVVLAWFALALLAGIPLVLIAAVVRLGVAGLATSVHVPGVLVFDGVIASLSFFFAPLFLVEVLCLAERGGPLWVWERAWVLSKSRRGQIRVLVGGLWVVSLAETGISAAGGPIGTLATGAFSLLFLLAQSALLAVIYDRLVVDEATIAVPVVRGTVVPLEPSRRGHRHKKGSGSAARSGRHP